jgi:hypothetical protein
VVLRVFDAVHGLEHKLLARDSLAEDVPEYLAVLAQLEGALLADNCGLVAQGLADIVAYLGERSLADPHFLCCCSASRASWTGSRAARRSRRGPPAGRPRHGRGRVPPPSRIALRAACDERGRRQLRPVFHRAFPSLLCCVRRRERGGRQPPCVLVLDYLEGDARRTRRCRTRAPQPPRPSQPRVACGPAWPRLTACLQVTANGNKGSVNLF